MSSILLILDMQNDLVHADGANGAGPLGEQVKARNIIASARTAIDKARSQGIPVAFVRVAFSSDYREANHNSQVFGPIAANKLLGVDTWGGQVHEDLGKLESDWDIVKHRVSPFYGTKLEVLLRQLKVDTIYCGGVSTPAVVQATVRDAHDRDYNVVVLDDICAAPSAQEHQNSLASIGRFCRVSTVADELN